MSDCALLYDAPPNMKFFKIIDKEECPYDVGKIYENSRNGIHFFSSQYILDYLHRGDVLYELIPLENFIETNGEFKANKIRILSIHYLNKLSTWKFMLENGCPLHNFMYYVVKYGNVKILKWAFEQIGCKWFTDIGYLLALQNDLESLKYVYKMNVNGVRVFIL